MMPEIAVVLVAMGIINPVVWAQIEEHCESDVVFVLDQSTSMTEDEFATMTEFSGIIIRDLKNFGEPDGTAAGVIKFSTRSTIVYGLDKYKDAAKAYAATRDILFDGGKTNTHLALRDMKMMLDNGRKDVAKVAILITDGDADDTPATLAAAKAVHAAGYNLAVIAIGTFLKLDELKKLASKPSLFHPIANFDELQHLKQDINQIVCHDVCPTEPYDPRIPSFRPEQARATQVVDAEVDLLQAQPFSPLVWSARGLCTGNDTSIVDITTAFVGEVKNLVDASQTLEDFKKECYRASMDELLDELKKTIVDCKKIAKLMTCAVKILKLIQETVNPDLVPSGTALRDTWQQYSQTVGSVTSPTEAARIISLQEQLIKDWQTQRDATSDGAEKARIQQQIDELQRTIDLNKLKLEYDVMVKDMVAELAKNPRQPGQITALQARMAAQLKLMKAASDDATEKNNMQAAITRLEKVIGANDRYRQALAALNTEENRRPIDPAQLIAQQKNVRTALNEMKTNAGSTVEGNAIQTVSDQLNDAITFNERVNQLNNIVTQITTELANTPPDHAKVVGLKKQQVVQLKQVRDLTSNAALKQSLQGDIDFIEKEIPMNEAKIEYNKQIAIYNQEVAKNPADKAKVLDASRKMVAELNKLLPLTDAQPDKNAIQQLIRDIETGITCYAA